MNIVQISSNRKLNTDQIMYMRAGERPVIVSNKQVAFAAEELETLGNALHTSKAFVTLKSFSGKDIYLNKDQIVEISDAKDFTQVSFPDTFVQIREIPMRAQVVLLGQKKVTKDGV